MGNIKAYKKGVNIKLPISKQIDVNFRDYALYVLENRGIPSFYDGLTNVQKYILQNAPTSYTKTISLIGSCIKSGYSHGDSSLEGAINKLARPYNCAEQVMIGDGFFGSPVKNEAAAARYTSIKINSSISNIIKEYSFLNEMDEGKWKPLWLRVPIGLTTSIMGIAVGYRTSILPRSIEDMEKYLSGKIKEVHPTFINFSGKVSRFQNMDRSWLIEGKTIVSNKNKEIRVTCLPPMLKYKKFLRKIEDLKEEFGDRLTVQDNSRDDIDITFKFRGRSTSEFEEIKNFIKKTTKIIVTETPVFVKDGSVLVYDRIEDYLDDYQYRLLELEYRRDEYYYNTTSDELEFQKAKKKYLEFMVAKKRTETEINKFLDKFDKKISKRLDAIRLRFLSNDELKKTVAKIKELEIEKKKLNKRFNDSKTLFEKTEDPTLKHGKKSGEQKTANLFDESDINDYDGIEVFQGDDVDEDEDEL